ncbi:orotidine 5'-phosphate decarboxylase [Leptospira inadai serovar Lyme str. 10]|uniref:Orotidine 5'-phosphate decarboxylase n=2 Tax=Leptospira inadai serovar Lyme TaxID=293084 RepID=V6HTM6_9LEPT|nr:orotidine-5'-phosphate decarboxylase [Leptospira inadai]EQA36059.1 orotidine 5'-phosphate decarboxylase [Leptospira inadai serovar Lyme str. 10]PNV76790.1 orotidine-5'-phosphate decarboxylase [Leptospira inadai serovar Lyme]
MDFHSKFIRRREELGSLLCVGIDPDISKLPPSLEGQYEKLFLFSREIVDATADFAVAYKPNIAFYEAFGSQGIAQFEKLIRHIKIHYPGIAIVADAKRGDLDNTARQYAKFFFKELGVDSLTLSPYMGADSIRPFLEDSSKLVFLLCLTSNPDSSQFQKKTFSETGRTLYKEVAALSETFSARNVGLVVGATHPSELGELRALHPDRIFLIPGYGAQGASLEDVIAVCGKNSLINSSRSVIFASSGPDFAEAARKSAESITVQMRKLLPF